ncbi:hypothetical protein BCR32DRAFT_277109 [Anaeromyces robustus]|uniref:Uncharacterized protein n=1 Tax=Anaeromyces robustus TaxID=1754192 RepID=A0A1Y1XGJ5_9FUNG|nr:hypothetical protein BCR32DRAFT_277109 [Anaeromyces robustus]|eukprot:ORX84504.1 hypothetical protein BCR32DRAFT_277109 [Anaeromyces robustus]
MFFNKGIFRCEIMDMDMDINMEIDMDIDMDMDMDMNMNMNNIDMDIDINMDMDMDMDMDRIDDCNNFNQFQMGKFLFLETVNLNYYMKKSYYNKGSLLSYHIIISILNYNKCLDIFDSFGKSSKACLNMIDNDYNGLYH